MSAFILRSIGALILAASLAALAATVIPLITSAIKGDLEDVPPIVSMLATYVALVWWVCGLVAGTILFVGGIAIDYMDERLEMDRSTRSGGLVSDHGGEVP